MTEEQFLKNPQRILTGLASLLALVAAMPATAGITTFSDRTAFLAATGATRATDDLPSLGQLGGNYSSGTVTYARVSGEVWVGGGSAVSDWTTLLTGNDIAINGLENLDLQLAAPVFALGFEFVEPSSPTSRPGGCYVNPCTDSTFSVVLRAADGNAVGSFAFNAPDDVAAFVGVRATQAFSLVQIRETTGTHDDEYFGQVYTSTAAVPEPATWALMLAGVLGVARFAVRRQR